MTTDAERECYYRLAREGAGKGAIVELGAWVGASTAYLAAALRDAGTGKVQVYDNFELSADHARKAAEFYAEHEMEEVPIVSCLDAFQRNLGPLIDHVEIHQGSIEQLTWDGAPISVLISDAPKDVPRISAVLTKFAQALGPGSVMAWQDFCHFPSYPIPACLYRLRRHFEVVEAVTPGSTLVFRLTSAWGADEVSATALALDRWTVDEIEAAWSHWLPLVPAEKRALFSCGAALFLFDGGHMWRAATWLKRVCEEHAGEILPKWRSLEARTEFAKRYWPLVAILNRTAPGTLLGPENT